MNGSIAECESSGGRPKVKLQRGAGGGIETERKWEVRTSVTVLAKNKKHVCEDKPKTRRGMGKQRTHNATCTNEIINKQKKADAARPLTRSDALIKGGCEQG